MVTLVRGAVLCVYPFLALGVVSATAAAIDSLGFGVAGVRQFRDGRLRGAHEAVGGLFSASQPGMGADRRFVAGVG